MGESLKDKPSICRPPIPINKQVECIMDNLTRANIRHLDCPSNGQNICFDGRTIALIDFDSSVIGDNTSPSTLVERWSSQYGKGFEYKSKFAQQLRYTIDKSSEVIYKSKPDEVRGPGYYRCLKKYDVMRRYNDKVML